ncbi:MAG: EamA family transporter, partial [Desulfobacteraceae bacterium]|nr:EamA family transporter [Desulfobacteraceae bacterium]
CNPGPLVNNLSYQYFPHNCQGDYMLIQLFKNNHPNIAVNYAISSGPTNLLLVTFLIPINAILLGVMVLGEQLGWEIFVGMGMIFIGLVAIDGRLIKKITPL